MSGVLFGITEIGSGFFVADFGGLLVRFAESGKVRGSRPGFADDVREMSIPEDERSPIETAWAFSRMMRDAQAGNFGESGYRDGFSEIWDPMAGVTREFLAFLGQV